MFRSNETGTHSATAAARFLAINSHIMDPGKVPPSGTVNRIRQVSLFRLWTLVGIVGSMMSIRGSNAAPSTGLPKSKAGAFSLRPPHPPHASVEIAITHGNKKGKKGNFFLVACASI